MSERERKDPGGETPDSELRRVLDSAAGSPARSEFKERLRAEFVAGEPSPAVERGDEAEPALVALLDRDPAPIARAEFKAQLSERFVNLAPAAAAASPPELAPAVPRAAQTQRTRLRLLVGGAVAAAAAVTLLFTQGVFTSSTPKWHALPGDFAGLQIDGESIAGLSGAELDDRLSSARQVATGAGTLRLEYEGDRFVLELGENTVLGLDRMPEAPLAKDLVLIGTEGSFRVATGPSFPGTELQFATSLFDARVTGTVFGIDVLAEGICLCVTEGAVDLVPTLGAAGEPLDVQEGRRCSVSWEGKTAQDKVCPPHAAPLEGLASSWP